MTVFLRVLDVSVDEKAGTLLRAASALNDADNDQEAFRRVVFECDPEVFSAVPGSPFAYWISDAVRGVFQRCSPFEEKERTVKQGLATADDFRFVRAWWEVPTSRIHQRWFGFAKGGTFSPFYSDTPLCLEWHTRGAILKAKVIAEHGNAGKRIYNEEFYFRPGLTWPLRGVRLSAQAVPSGCVFSVAGKMAFTALEELPAFLAIFNSMPFSYLMRCLSDAVRIQFEVGLIQQTPVPNLADADVATLAGLARRAWSLKRSLDTTNETSHAFCLPPGPNEHATGLHSAEVELELARIQQAIDDQAFRLYGVNDEDRFTIEASSKRAAIGSDGEVDETSHGEDAYEGDARTAASADAVISWLVGVGFGRFDPRLATGERAIPPEPEPFDALPSRSPGMYPEGEEPAGRPDVLVDDEGHADDLAARALAIADSVRVDVLENLRAWLAKEFFPLHIKMYSKSRRKAPIYWQLATPSASYSVWLYIHAFSKDTLFRVQNDYAALKLAHEERRLESLTSDLRNGATATQRKQLATQEFVVEELRAFLDEVKRVAPLWNPNLDDGVVINFAPLWRLVPQNKSWQKELKTTWDSVCEGKYDWSHLAMHLWPERVVPKCAKDRSLAIAHGLEDVFWVEGEDGKRTARKTPTKSVDELVKARTSPAVKSSLKSLLDAPAAIGKTVARGRVGSRRKGAAAFGDDA